MMLAPDLDLACRNCLVMSDLTIKVSDFGLSRTLQEENDYYRQKREECLPVRWMAPESLIDLRFSTICLCFCLRRLKLHALLSV